MSPRKFGTRANVSHLYHHDYSIFTSAAKFTFPIVVSYSALEIGLYLFYRKIVIAQFKMGEKNGCVSYSFIRN